MRESRGWRKWGGSRATAHCVCACVRFVGQAWLTLSRTEGTLAAPASKKDGQAITLSVMAIRPDVYSTYILVETVGNAADLKTIRVIMEVRRHAP